MPKLLLFDPSLLALHCINHPSFPGENHITSH
jgi:hypothetical protein